MTKKNGAPGEERTRDLSLTKARAEKLRSSQWQQQDCQASLVRSPTELEAMLRPLVDAGVNEFDASTRRFHTPAFRSERAYLGGMDPEGQRPASLAVGGVGLGRDLYGSYAAGGSNGVDNLNEVRRRITAGEFDLIGVGRPSSQWTKKAATGERFLPFKPAAVRNLI
ncbi:hypothetical protein [Novosphingobium sp. 9U]|uniref:hypothetical protein n=1 Tax=Novosphingobium sp. 9U TaxID=2653158 RepID=UPI0012F1446D|nr:hypothetical protein [Novosphingobium sp. 9U]VWX48194.1 hypothetical protein NOVOSPHI9U_130005 [Novosphingobium sp. 9U]